MTEPDICELSAVILVGGLGTRLRDVLTDRPKPMASINGRPFLETLVTQLARAGVRDIVMCVGYRAEIIEEHFGDGSAHGVRIRYAREKELLGTAGAVRNALDLVTSDPFFVLNGDSYCSVDFAKLAKHHRGRTADATIVGVEASDCSRYGKLKLKPDGSIERFIEKAEASGSGWINGGVYVLQQAALRPLVPNKCASLERDVFPALVERGTLHSMKTSGVFIDIGIPSELQRAQTLFATSDVSLAP